MSSAVADSGTVQANTSLAMVPKPRLFFLSTGMAPRVANSYEMIGQVYLGNGIFLFISSSSAIRPFNLAN